MEVKDIIRNRRIEMDMTMKEVADLVGVSEATISRWESGDIANMRRDKIAALANALKLSPAVIMGWEDPKPEYYYDPETTQKAQELFSNKDMRVLFDAAQGCRPSDLQMAADLLTRLKETNPDG